MLRACSLVLLVATVRLAAVEPFAVVEQRFERPSVGDPAFTVLSDTFDPRVEGTRESLTYSAARTTAVRVGIVLPGGDRLEGAGWYDDQRQQSTVSSPTTDSSTMDILYPAANAFGVERGGTATAAGELRAWTLDVAYAHVVSGLAAPWSAEAAIGLRRAGLRDDFAAEYSGPTMSTRRVEMISDAIGTGLRVGGMVRRGLFDSPFGVSVAGGYAVLRGRLSTNSVAYQPGVSIDEREDGSEAAGFAMLDLAVGVDVRLGAGFTLAAAYRLERWDGMVRHDLFGTSAGDGGQRAVDRPTAMWDGFVVSLAWTAPPP